MSRKMLIDATHPEETRVVVVDGAKVEDFDFESINKRQISGNIYLAKVTRVEPSLQAAFVEYGGNRHGFLAFSEIHPDYYQIPRADREALLAAEEAAQAEDDEEERRPGRSDKRQERGRRRRGAKPAGDGDAGASAAEPETAEAQPADPEAGAATPADAAPSEAAPEGQDARGPESIAESAGADDAERVSEPFEATEAPADAEAPAKPRRRRRRTKAEQAAEAASAEAEPAAEPAAAPAAEAPSAEAAPVEAKIAEPVEERVETVGAATVEEETPVRRVRPRSYKIQEVIKVRQIMLVQVVKEERGNKGAALTTYLSLAGRYCVLMPNTARGGGVSRKITSAEDRKKLKEIAAEFDLPKGMGIIIRTAGSQRTKAEIRRDYEFLLRQWEEIRTLTLKSIAPALIYEEGSLIKRCIRDLYSKDIEEILVEGDDAYREAKDYMRMLMPSHAKAVQQYRDPTPLFSRHQVESYLASMFNPTVQLKSGGYIVIGVTEALVAIDVNSGRSTREGSIEETALKTNLEAADEIARQLRLRDLAGLIVIDFIDMDERRNNAAVEKRMKDRLSNDRARIQMGRISSFGLMELSRQRLRPGMLEATTAACPHCHGTGLVRSADNLALSILREVEEEATRRRAAAVKVAAPVAVANYIVNHKRDHLLSIETRYGVRVLVEGDPALVSPDHKVERQGAPAVARVAPPPSPTAVRAETAFAALDDPRDVEEDEDVAEPVAVAETQPKRENGAGDGQARTKRRRGKRGGRKRRREDEVAPAAGSTVPDSMAIVDEADDDAPAPDAVVAEPVAAEPAPAAAEAIAAEPAAGPAAPMEAAEPPAKPRRRRTRKAEPETAPAAAAAPKPDAPADAPSPPAAAAPAAPEPERPAPEPETESAAASAAPEPADALAEPEPDRPKRRGWWSFGSR